MANLDQIEILYNDALALQPQDRSAFLDRMCGADSELRREIESLLMCGGTETCLDKDAIEFAAEALAQEGAGLLVGRTLGRYQLLSAVGRGGMGEVYCAVDSRLNRLVAVKVLPPYVSDNPEWSQRLEQEARSVAALNHPHICILHDVGHDAGTNYLVFEYLVGELLSERLAGGPLPLPQALRYAAEMADALDSTHQQGIVHCDLKPQNIMLTKSGVKLLDFGIAELQSSGTTAPAATAGTLAYMAPEQIEGREADARTDIFAFGMVTYEMLTGRPAFQGDSQASLAASILNDNPPPPSQFVSGVPPTLDFLVGRCLSKLPSERWQSICDVLFMLRWIATGV
jgi:serine/threonine protein kinase